MGPSPNFYGRPVAIGKTNVEKDEMECCDGSLVKTAKNSGSRKN